MDEREPGNPLTLTLSPQGRGERTRRPQRANDLAIRNPSLSRVKNPLTLTLSPQSRGEGTRRPWWILGLFAVYLILAAVLPALDDEVYYWCWAKELQWSYYDHPPMTAVLIRLSTSLFGD